NPRPRLRRNGGGWVGGQMSVFRLAAGVIALAMGAAVVTALAANPEVKTDPAAAAAIAANSEANADPAAPAAANSDRLSVPPPPASAKARRPPPPPPHQARRSSSGHFGLSARAVAVRLPVADPSRSQGLPQFAAGLTAHKKSGIRQQAFPPTCRPRLPPCVR